MIDAATGARSCSTAPAPASRRARRGRRPPRSQAIDDRTEYGMRADPAYVQSLLDDDREYTEPERRYVKSADRLDENNATST